MKKSLKYLLTAGLALGSVLPMVRGQASATNLTVDATPVIEGENYKITQDLRNSGLDNFNPDKAFYKLDFEENLFRIGCTNIGNVKGWTASETSTETSKLESISGDYHFEAQNFNYWYEVPTNQVVGWENVAATFTANNEDTANLDGGFKVPLTRSTTTHTNGLSLGVLVDSGVATNGSSRAEFEAAAVYDGNTNGVPDAADWLIGGTTNYTGGLEAAITITNLFSEIIWTPNLGTNRAYTVSSCTNLVEASTNDNAWVSYEPVIDGSGKRVDTNDFDSAVYRVEVALP